MQDLRNVYSILCQADHAHHNVFFSISRIAGTGNGKLLQPAELSKPV